MRVRGNVDTVTAGPGPVAVAGAAIRYGFYFVGILVLTMIGIGLFSLFRFIPTAISDPPAFRIASPHLARHSVSGHVVSGSRLGRAEVRQYGQLHNRETDLAVVLVMPPKGIGMGTAFAQDLRDLNLLRADRAMLSTTHYDLDTRFGEFRGTDMRVNTDGRWKQCIAFRSRLDTASVYLTGWYCDGTGSKPGADALACMLDKFTIEGELASKEADAFMRGRMAKPAFCQADQVTQTTDTRTRQTTTSPQRWSQPNATRNRYQN